MSGVRVLVGTRKGAFILTSDGKREKWDVSGPHFAGWEIYHLKGSPVDPNRLYASQSSGWFGQVMQRSNDGGKTWEPVGNKFAYDGSSRHASVVRRHAASLGIQARLASRAFADRSRHRLCGSRRCRDVPLHRWRAELAGAFRLARARLGTALASRARAACACTRSCSIRTIPSACSSPFPRRARFAPTMAAKPGSRSTADCSPKYIPDPDGGSRPLRSSHRHASLAPGCACSCRSIGT